MRNHHTAAILFFFVSASVLGLKSVQSAASSRSLLNWLASVVLSTIVAVLLPPTVALRCARRPLRALGLGTLVLMCGAAMMGMYVEHVRGRMQSEGILSGLVSGLYVARLWPLAFARDDPSGSASAWLVTQPQSLNLCFYNYGQRVLPFSKLKLAHQWCESTTSTAHIIAPDPPQISPC